MIFYILKYNSFTILQKEYSFFILKLLCHVTVSKQRYLYVFINQCPQFLSFFSYFFSPFQLKTIACVLCCAALHPSVSYCTSIQEPSLQRCIVGWEEPPSKMHAAMHSSTLARWYQLHHNFITSSSLWILLTLTFYRDWQHKGRDAWQCQRLNPLCLRYSIVGFDILLFVDEVLCLFCKKKNVKNPSSYSGITLRE